MSKAVIRIMNELDKVYVTLWDRPEDRTQAGMHSARFFVYGMKRAKKERAELLRLAAEEGYSNAVCVLKKAF